MTPNEERALSALLTSKTKLEAAEKAGITDRTMRRYFENPEFCQRYREAFAGVVQDATRRAQQLLSHDTVWMAANRFRAPIQDTTQRILYE